MCNSCLNDAQFIYDWCPTQLWMIPNTSIRGWIEDASSMDGHGSRMNGRWVEDGSRMDPRRVIIFQSSCLIAIKTDFRPHLASILASNGTHKHWFLMGGVSKIKLFTFLILNVVCTRLLLDSSLLGSYSVSTSAPKMTKPSHIRCKDNSTVAEVAKH